VPAIEQYFQQNEIAQSSYEYQTAIDSEEKIVVGVNKFAIDENVEIPRQSINEDAVKTQLDRLASTRANRNLEQVNSSLVLLEKSRPAGDKLAASNHYSSKGDGLIG